MNTDAFLRYFWICAAVSGAGIIARQLLREQLFVRVLEKRSFTLDSTWYTRSRIGTDLRQRFVWGKISREMLKVSELRNLILLARILSCILYLSNTGIFLLMASHFYH